MQKLAFVLSLGLAPAAIAQCTFTPGSVLVADNTSGGDTIYPSQPIGFAFPLGTGSFTDIHISDHGFAFLSNGGVPTVPAGGALTYNALTADFIGNGPCIAPFWADANLGTAGATITIESTATSCVVTWTNVTTWPGILPEFSFQMTLLPTGEVMMNYDANVNNYGSTFTPNAIVGITPGAPAALPAMSDLSSGPITADPTVFEDFQTVLSFDLGNNALHFIPTSPGWIVLPLGPPAGCAGVNAYGIGCTSQESMFYEAMPAAGFNLAAGTTITLLRQPNGYLAVDAIPGTFVPPGAAAYNIAAGLLDGEETVALSSPLQIANGGTTSALTVTTKGMIALSATGNGIDWTPTGAEFAAYVVPTIAAMWHDFNQTAAGSGLILFEEVGGIAYVTWDGVASFAGTGLFDSFQVQLNLGTGDITIVYVTIANDGNDYMVGFRGPDALIDNGPISLATELAIGLLIQDNQVVPLELAANAPVLGSNWDLTTTNIDALSPVSITFLGNAAVNPGLPMAAIGFNAPGCSIYINTILGDLTALNAGGMSVASLPIPNNAALTGSILTAQSICLTLLNPANLLASNGVEGLLGN